MSLKTTPVYDEFDHVNASANKTVLLFVDDRPCTLAENLFRRTDVQPILLRFKQVLHELSDQYRDRTRDLLSFIVDMERPIEAEVERFREWLTRCGFDLYHFCNPSEPRQRISQRFAELLGLPCLSQEQVDWVRNKLKMKKKLGEIGLRTAEYGPVSSLDDVFVFAQRNGWPVVLKPTEGFACIETYKLSEMQDLKKIELSSDWQWMVEAFIAYEEFEACALIFNKEVLDVYISYFPAPPLDATEGAINANISLRRGSCSFEAEFKRIVQQIVSGLELDHGYLHMEFFISEDDTIVVSEVALRLAGCEIPANHGLARGFNIFDALIDIHLNRRPRLIYTKDRCVGDLLLPVKSGVVQEITPLPELMRKEGVIGGKLSFQPGDVIRPRRASHLSSGYLHVEGETPQEVEDRMRRILQSFFIETAATGFVQSAI